MVSTYWQRDDPFSMKTWLKLTHPLLKAACFDTFCLIAPQPHEIEKEVQLHLTRTRQGLSNEDPLDPLMPRYCCTESNIHPSKPTLHNSIYCRVNNDEIEGQPVDGGVSRDLPRYDITTANVQLYLVERSRQMAPSSRTIKRPPLQTMYMTLLSGGSRRFVWVGRTSSPSPPIAV